MQVGIKAMRLACAALFAPALAFSASAAHAAPATAYVTSETAGVGVIDLQDLTLAKTIDVGKDGPRGLSLNKDGTRLYVANKATADLSEIDTSTGKVVRRVKIGKNPEFVRVYDGYAYVTYEPGESGGPPKQGEGGKPEHDDDDANSPPAEIAIVDLKTLKVKHSVKSGHETEGVEFSPDRKQMLVTNEGDDTVSVYQVGTGKPLRTVNLPKGSRPRGIKAAPNGKQYVVTLENTNKFVVLEAGSMKISKTVDTKMGPYGVSFDPSGKHLLVAAARDKTLQVFDGTTYEHMNDVTVGQRCWHFSFTPDGAKILLACGRSNAVYVLDATNYQEVKQIGDLPLAWGIVTYPSSAGSIVGR
jgi:YVTN family beta-propeller protein